MEFQEDNCPAARRTGLIRSTHVNALTRSRSARRRRPSASLYSATNSCFLRWVQPLRAVRAAGWLDLSTVSSENQACRRSRSCARVQSFDDMKRSIDYLTCKAENQNKLARARSIISNPAFTVEKLLATIACICVQRSTSPRSASRRCAQKHGRSLEQPVPGAVMLHRE
jgi:hypothetical protein